MGRIIALPPSPPSSLELLRAEASACVRCPLAASRTQVVFGEGSTVSGLTVVGEAPGAAEDARGRPFVGRAGKTLDRLLHENELHRGDVYVVNVVMCRPPNDRPPRAAEIAACAPYLEAQLRLVRPDVILALGATATRRLVGPGVNLETAHGVPHHRGDATVVPTFHPAALNRRHGRRDEAAADFRLARARLSR